MSSNAELEAHVATISSSLDAVWVMTAAVLVFFMQAGFGLLEAGAVRVKNTQNILIKNLLDAACSAISFYLLGYGLAFGEAEGAGKSNPFIGNDLFALFGKFDQWTHWQFQWAFAATAATIVSGAVAERTQMRAYVAYSTLLTIVVYPLVVHWCWTGSGWLAGLGYVDFAGSSVVHMVGGFSGLMGALALGPRIGRFRDDGSVQEIRGHSMALYMLGVMILWFGWYGFNAGSTLGADGAMVLAGKVAVNTTLAASAGLLAALGVAYYTVNHLSLLYALNGVLAGLVSITAGCATVEPPGAIVIGLLGGLLLTGVSRLVLKFGIDDPLDAFAVHGACGAWGVISTGLFASREGYILSGLFGAPDTVADADEWLADSANWTELTDYGLFYGGHIRMLGVQLLGVVAIAVWSVIWSALLFFGMDAVGWLRVKPEHEIKGLDQVHHGGAAYVADSPVELVSRQLEQGHAAPRRRRRRY